MRGPLGHRLQIRGMGDQLANVPAMGVQGSIRAATAIGRKLDALASGCRPAIEAQEPRQLRDRVALVSRRVLPCTSSQRRGIPCYAL